MALFKKKIDGLGVGSKRPPPRCYDELKDEIKKWPRIGMKGSEGIQKSGFLRTFDVSHVYRKNEDGHGHEVDEDIERLIVEGKLIEFKDFNNLHDTIRRDPAHQTKTER